MFKKLHEQAMAKMSLTFIITASKAEKFQNPKSSICVETPCNCESLGKPCYVTRSKYYCYTSLGGSGMLDYCGGGWVGVC